MKILVTGGAGFIGSHVAQAYAAQGHEVAVLDNFSTGTEENVSSSLQIYRVDITDLAQVEKALQDFSPDVINHHAAHIQVGYSVENPQFDATSNVIGLLNIMQTAKNLGTVKKVIMASTGGAMYGDVAVPFKEEYPPQPLSPYGISKRAGELYLYFYMVQYGIPYVVLRYSNVYGPRQNPHGESGVIAIFMERILQGKDVIIHGDGTHTRDYVYISDVVAANRAALESQATGEFNIGTGREISTNDVFHAVVQAMQVDLAEKHGPERPGEQVRSALDATKAREVLGWQPTVGFEEGVQLTARWMLEQA